MLTEEQSQDIEFCRDNIISEISSVLVNSDKLKHLLTKEVMISVVYLRIFSAYLQEKKFDNLEEAWRFMNDLKGIIEKVFYIAHYFERLKESSKHE